MIEPSPTVRRWELAARLYHLREARNKTLEQVSEATKISVSQLSRLENNKRGIAPRDVVQLGQYYGLTPLEIDELVELSKKAREPGWWQRYTEIERGYSTYVGLEAAANTLDQCSRAIVPGLLQTSEYAAALLKGLNSDGLHGEEYLTQQVHVREQRQQHRLFDQPISATVVIDEAVIHRRVGGPDVMKRQLERLIGLSDLASVNLLVVPFTAGSYPGMDGEFAILAFNEEEMKDVVYVEGLLGQFFLDQADDVSRYRRAFEASTRSALSDADSRKRILSVARTLTKA